MTMPLSGIRVLKCAAWREAPELGQHTEEILLEFGCAWDDISRLREDGAI